MAASDTVTVTIQCDTPDGNPIASASIKAQLNVVEIDEGYILTEVVEGTADANGTLEMDLWPNALGDTSSYYTFSIINPEDGDVQKIEAVIPNYNCNLHDVATLPAYPGKPDGQNAVDWATEWANKAEDSLVSSSAGGDEVDDYSALHHAAKASASATAAASAVSSVGLLLTFDDSTSMADPGTGLVRFNNATVASVTALAVDATSSDTGSPDVSDFIATWADSTNTVKGHVVIKKKGTPATFAIFTVSAVTDNTGWLQLTVAHVDSNGTWTDADEMYAQFVRAGDKGDTGDTGATGLNAGIKYNFDSSTDTASDPGTADVRLNHASFASVTEIGVDDNNGESGNPDYSSALATWDDSTSTIKGFLKLVKNSAQENFAIYSISAISDATTHYRVTVSHIASSGSFSNADELSLYFTRNGDKGDTGSTGATGAAAALFLDYQWNTSTSGDPGSGKILGNNVTISSVNQLNISETDRLSNDKSGVIAIFDDSTSASYKGLVMIVDVSDATNWAVFKNTGSITDAGGYDTTAVTYVASGGTLANDEIVSVIFLPAGDAGSVANSFETINCPAGTDPVASSGTDTLNLASGGAYLTITGDSGTDTITIALSAADVRTLINVEDGADVTDTTNVTAAGALMDSEVDANLKTFALPASTTISTFGASIIDDADEATFKATVNLEDSDILNAAPAETTTTVGALINAATDKATPVDADYVGLMDSAASNIMKKLSWANIKAALETYVAPGGRLTLSTAVPVMTSTVSGATTVYYTPHEHRYAPIWDGTNFVPTDLGGELSQATTDSTKSPAACTTNSNYDLFLWDDSGTLRCTRGPAWSSDTARGSGAGTTELTRVNGIYVNANAITNGPSAGYGTYVGTIRTNGSSQVDYIFGASSDGGTAAFFGVWNMYNRVDIYTMISDTTNSWNYTTETWRSVNNSSGNRVSFVRGLNEDSTEAKYLLVSSNTANAVQAGGIGLDSTSSPATGCIRGAHQGSVAISISSRYTGVPGLGFHYFQALEISQASGTTTFYGDGGGSIYQSGVNASLRG